MNDENKPRRDWKRLCRPRLQVSQCARWRNITISAKKKGFSLFPQVWCLLLYSLNMFNVYSTSLHPVFKHSVHPLKCWHCLAQPWTTSSFLPTLGFFFIPDLHPVSQLLSVWTSSPSISTVRHQIEQKKKAAKEKGVTPSTELRCFCSDCMWQLSLSRCFSCDSLSFSPGAMVMPKRKKKHKEATPDSWSEPYSSGSICENYTCDLYSKWGNWLFGEQREEIWFSRKTVKEIL